MDTILISLAIFAIGAWFGWTEHKKRMSTFPLWKPSKSKQPEAEPAPEKPASSRPIEALGVEPSEEPELRLRKSNYSGYKSSLYVKSPKDRFRLELASDSPVKLRQTLYVRTIKEIESSLTLWARLSQIIGDGMTGVACTWASSSSQFCKTLGSGEGSVLENCIIYHPKMNTKVLVSISRVNCDAPSESKVDPRVRTPNSKIILTSTVFGTPSTVLYADSFDDIEIVLNNYGKQNFEEYFEGLRPGSAVTWHCKDSKGGSQNCKDLLETAIACNTPLAKMGSVSLRVGHMRCMMFNIMPIVDGAPKKQPKFGPEFRKPDSKFALTCKGPGGKEDVTLYVNDIDAVDAQLKAWAEVRYADTFVNRDHNVRWHQDKDGYRKSLEREPQAKTCISIRIVGDQWRLFSIKPLEFPTNRKYRVKLSLDEHRPLGSIIKCEEFEIFGLGNLEKGLAQWARTFYPGCAPSFDLEHFTHAEKPASYDREGHKIAPAEKIWTVFDWTVPKEWAARDLDSQGVGVGWQIMRFRPIDHVTTWTVTVVTA